jgi:glycosyltransferase involved in cell wall biosynthesis
MEVARVSSRNGKRMTTSAANAEADQRNSLDSSEVCTLLMTEIGNMGGAERSCMALANWLSAHRVPRRFVLYRDTYGVGIHTNQPLDVVQLSPGRGARNKIAALRQFLRAHPTERCAPLLSGYQIALHATLAGARRFTTLMHDTPSLFGQGLIRTSREKLREHVSNAVVGYGLRRAEKLGGHTIVTSEYLKDECRRVFGVEARIVRMGGLPLSAPFQIRPVRDTLRLLSVQRVEANKRIDWILTSLAELEQDAVPLSSRVDWRLDVAGTGSALEMLRKMSADLGLAHRVCFHGFVSDEDLQELYYQAHLFLMPARQGYGIPAIEALQRGIPILLSRESGVSDILLNTHWATVFTGDAKQMTSKFREAVDNVISGKHHAEPPPSLPTEESWAEEVAYLCGWTRGQ